jgi:hypothetical protein
MAETLTLQGTGVTDNTILSNAADNNYSTLTTLSIGESNAATQIGRAIIKFDLSSIPQYSTITSATMTLYGLGSDESDNARVASVYRILQNMVITQSTWNSYATGSAWATAGCSNTTTDREATDISDGPTQPASLAENAAVTFTLTPSKIEEMITGGAFTNNGFLVQVATESSDQMGYKSTENATTTSRPKLVVVYELGSAPVTPGAGYFHFM